VNDGDFLIELNCVDTTFLRSCVFNFSSWWLRVRIEGQTTSMSHELIQSQSSLKGLRVSFLRACLRPRVKHASIRRPAWSSNESMDGAPNQNARNSRREFRATKNVCFPSPFWPFDACWRHAINGLDRDLKQVSRMPKRTSQGWKVLNSAVYIKNNRNNATVFSKKPKAGRKKESFIWNCHKFTFFLPLLTNNLNRTKS
jgi:hypothetical protein